MGSSKILSPQTEGTYRAQNTARRLKITVSADEKGLRHRASSD